MIFGLAKALRDECNLQLRAVAHRDFSEKPWPINGFPPDVIAYDPRREILALGDVVTSEDLYSTETLERIQAHTSLLMASGASRGERVPLHIAVSSEDQECLVDLLQELCLQVEITFWTWGLAYVSQI